MQYFKRQKIWSRTYSQWGAFWWVSDKNYRSKTSSQSLPNIENRQNLREDKLEELRARSGQVHFFEIIDCANWDHVGYWFDSTTSCPQPTSFWQHFLWVNFLYQYLRTEVCQARGAALPSPDRALIRHVSANSVAVGKSEHCTLSPSYKGLCRPLSRAYQTLWIVSLTIPYWLLFYLLDLSKVYCIECPSPTYNSFSGPQPEGYANESIAFPLCNLLRLQATG